MQQYGITDIDYARKSIAFLLLLSASNEHCRLLLTNLNAVSPTVSSMSKNSRRRNLSLLQPCQQYATVSTSAHAATGHSNVISRTICKCVSYLEVTGDAAAVKHNLTEENYIRAGYVNYDTDVTRLDCDVTHCNS